MKTATLALVLAFAVSAASRAEDFTLPNGTTLKDVKVSNATASRVNLTHADGIASVDLGQLTDEQRQRLGVSYDKDAAAAERLDAAKEDARRSADLTLAERAVVLNITIRQIVPGGVIGSAWSKRPDYDRIVEQQKQEIALLPKGTTRGIDTSAGVDQHGEIFLAGDFSGRVDGDSWEGRAWRIGTFGFTTVMGTQRTIPKWTSSPTEALRAVASLQ